MIFKFVAISFAILAVVACAEESKETPVLLIRELTFTASREGLSPESKTVRMDDGSTRWNAYEEISVFYGSGSAGGSKFTTQNNTLQNVVEFSGSVQMSGSGKDFWAVYPYSTDNSCDGSSITTVIPAVQIASEGNFSDDVFPAIAKTKTTEFAFWNICGGVKFFVSRSDIKSVTVKGNNSEPLAGKVKVAFGPDGTPVVQEVIDAKPEVTLAAPDDGAFKPGNYYYITLLPGALDGGITLTLYTSSEKGEIVSDNAQIIKRSIFGVLNNIDSKVQKWESTAVEPEYVDLGLSVKCATFNVGASKPEEYGDYFAWGETQPKSDYSWSTYKWCNGDLLKLTYYCSQSSYWDGSGSPDGKTVLDPEGDAAHVNWGGSWRMPTDAEWTELRTKCTWTWTSENGVNGRKVTGPNGKSIFLPSAGGRHDTDLSGVGSWGIYWSSSLGTENPDNPDCAFAVSFGSGSVSRGYGYRCHGYMVRPVYGEFIPVASISLNKTSIEMTSGGIQHLTATISPSNATANVVHWMSSDESIVMVDKTGLVTSVGIGTATIIAYGSSGVSATCTVTVKIDLSLPDAVEAVDLGLPSGLKWATMNVGATQPEYYGEYFAWGETEPKTDYSWSTYKFRQCGDGSWDGQKYNMIYNKYCNQSSYWGISGFPDNKTVLDPEDDAAHVNWGGSWRMPTVQEWEELIDNCTWTWTSNYNGTQRKGIIVTSQMSGYTNKSIFLPAAGERIDTDYVSVGFEGFYWSSSLHTLSPNYPYDVTFNSVNNRKDYVFRYFGQSIRPVSE